MRKCIYLSFVMLCVTLIVGCSSGNTPGAAAKKYAGYMQSGNYEKFVDGIAFSDEASAEDLKQAKDMYVAMFKEKGDKKLQEKGGIKSIEVASETIAEEGKTAVVELSMTYGNGETDTDKVDMVLDNGNWKMSMKK